MVTETVVVEGENTPPELALLKLELPSTTDKIIIKIMSPATPSPINNPMLFFLYGIGEFAGMEA
jgi:hypothetical protein